MHTDVVIVGGGVVGSACAYFLAADPGFDGRVVVVERDPTYRDGSTGRSAGSIRQQFSTPENIEMSRFGIEFLRQAERYLSVAGEAVETGLAEGGYLFLATAPGMAVLEANHALQRRHGADVALLEPERLATRFPWLNVSDLAAGSLGLSGEGWFDPWALLAALRRKSISLGARYLADEVIGLESAGSRVMAVRCAHAGRIGAGTVINAAGPRAAAIAAMAGLALPVRPRCRSVFVIHCRTPVEGCPLLVDVSGVYVRPEGEYFICGTSPPPGRDPDTLELEVDHALFEEIVWPALAHRVPAFEAVKVVSAWAGHYAVNTFDHNAILGPHPERPNLLLANGFSGHGLQHSPAVGRAIAELVVHGRFVTLDLARLGVERYLEGRALREANVV